eukprot:8574144-Lingulodinium_polyedra.AAC.1
MLVKEQECWAVDRALTRYARVILMREAGEELGRAFRSNLNSKLWRRLGMLPTALEFTKLQVRIRDE